MKYRGNVAQGQGARSRGVPLPLLMALCSVQIEDISSPPTAADSAAEDRDNASLFQQGEPVPEHECQDSSFLDLEPEHELSARKRRRQKKISMDIDVKKRFNARLAAKEGQMYISMEAKAARAKKLKEQLAKCSSKLNEVVSTHKLLDLNYKTTPKALEDLAIACSLDDHDIAQLRSVLAVVEQCCLYSAF